MRKCDHCRTYEVKTIDYRCFNDVTGRYLSCKYCIGLSNKIIRIIRNKNEDPRKFYSGV